MAEPVCREIDLAARLVARAIEPRGVVPANARDVRAECMVQRAFDPRGEACDGRLLDSDVARVEHPRRKQQDAIAANDAAAEPEAEQPDCCLSAKEVRR